MIRRAALACLLALTATSALASAPEKAEEKVVGQYVDIYPVAMPIVAEGQLINYVFVTIRLQLTATADASKWRAKEPYFRDALARLGHRTSFANTKDYASVDASRLTAAFQREAVAIAGKDVKGVTITAQTAKQRLGLPKPGPIAPRTEIRP